MTGAVRIKNAVIAAGSVVGGALSSALGGWDYFLQVLIGIMAADYITGVIAAVFKKSGKTENGALSSSAGFAGLCRKCVIIILVWAAAMLDRVMNSEFTRQAVCLFFIANEGISVLENAGLMGVKYPQFLKNMLEALRDKQDPDAGK